jgi:tetratricopeptide (TPR) repeat protein
VIRFELGRDDDVLSHCRELAEIVPTDPDPWRVSAMVHRNRGHWDHFVDSARKSLALSKADAGEFRQELVDGLVHLGETKDARKEFDRVAKNRPDLVPRAPLLEARLLLLEGRSDQVATILTDYLRKYPDDPEALLLHGKLLLAQESFGLAINVLQRLITIDPANHDAHYQLGQSLARRGDDDDRAQYHLRLHREILDSKVQLYHLEQLAAREPKNILVRRELARNYARLGLDELAEFWTRAAEAVARPQ